MSFSQYLNGFVQPIQKRHIRFKVNYAQSFAFDAAIGRYYLGAQLRLGLLMATNSIPSKNLVLAFVVHYCFFFIMNSNEIHMINASALTA
uniref:Uncharacterized protein n=1 Tax=Solanum lycopersicum TaxID=4081 RepID=A0A3Q7H3S4_SOLLC